MMGFKSKLHSTLPDIAGSYGAHGFGLLPRAGEFIIPHGDPSGAAVIGDNGRMYLSPIYIPKIVVISGGTFIACKVTVAGSAGAIVRMGLYLARAGDLRPGKLLVDCGTRVTTVGNEGEQDFAHPSGVDQRLPEGVYWGALVPQGSPVTQATFSAMRSSPMFGNSFAFTGTKVAGIHRTNTLGALPTDLTSENLADWPEPVPYPGLLVSTW